VAVEAEKMSATDPGHHKLWLTQESLPKKGDRRALPAAVFMSIPSAGGVRVIVQVPTSLQQVGCMGVMARKSHHWIPGSATTRYES